MSAEPPEVASAKGALAFGFLFIDATKTGVEALGISALAAASAFVENGQNAWVRFGGRVAVNKRIASPRMKD